MTFDSLPDDCWTEIINNCDDPELDALACVCKSLNRIATDEAFYEKRCRKLFHDHPFAGSWRKTLYFPQGTYKCELGCVGMPKLLMYGTLDHNQQPRFFPCRWPALFSVAEDVRSGTVVFADGVRVPIFPLKDLQRRRDRPLLAIKLGADRHEWYCTDMDDCEYLNRFYKRSSRAAALTDFVRQVEKVYDVTGAVLT
eukprot:TRINITY_DN3386_c0_g1_i1.p1 TRINITY_DN3386_c0_g1~~TRINITY_DN3386_c0_g1_i1.p1  ORF type:complete len:197 (-),score=18.94 TRINITY_DN3386_c0_g1_i1:140-730(-)